MHAFSGSSLIPLVIAFSLVLIPTPASAGVVAFDSAGVEIKTREASFTKEQVDGVEVVKARLEPTEKWSFIRFVPSAGSWDLSRYSGVEVQITNTGSTAVKPGVRVDEAGEMSREAWNSAALQEIEPGDTKTIIVHFGKDYNEPKEIKTSQIGAVHIFLGKKREEASTLIIGNIKGID